MIEELIKGWREQYEQWKRPEEPPWEEIEASFLERMKQYYKQTEQESKARLVDEHADIDRYKRLQQVLSGQTMEESALRESDFGFIFESLADVQAKPIPWLWPHRVPRGMLTLLAGDPGEGKSYIALDMAARVSKGREWPDGNGDAPLGTTLLVTMEDPSEYVIKPRLELLGADTSRIVRLDSVERGKRILDLGKKEDRSGLRTSIEEKGASLVVIDTINGYLGQGLDTFRDNEVRDVLQPLAKIAEETDVALVGLIHLNKDSEKKALYRLLGSIGFVGVARVVLAVGKAPQGDTPDLRLFGGLKSNLGPLPPSLTYRIDGTGLHWGDEVDCDLGGLIEGYGKEHDTTKLDEACQFIERVLPIGKKTTTKDLDKQAREQGFTGGTWQRAKQRMGVKSEPLPDSQPHVYLSFRGECL